MLVSIDLPLFVALSWGPELGTSVALVDGSGEGPQIGDSTGDRIQNLWFHKRIKLELELGLLTKTDLGSQAWIRIGGRLLRGSDPHSQLEQISNHRDMDPQYATVDQLTEITDTMASLRDAILGLGQRIDRHRPNHYWFQEAPYLTLLHLHLHHHHLGLLYNKTIQFHLRHHPQFNQSHGLGHLSYMARIDRIKQMIRSLHVSDRVMGWNGYDDLLVAALPVEFRMLDIERYTGIGCPRIHLQLYSVVMRGHRLDEAQMIMLFPLSLSGAVQRCGCIPEGARGPQALCGIEEGIARGLWADSSSLDSTGKKPGSGSRPSDDLLIYIRHRSRYMLHRLLRGHLYSSISSIEHRLHRGWLGRLVVTTDPIPTHDTRAVPSPPRDVHLIEFSRDEIFMMGWDGEAPQPISLYKDSDFSGYIHG
ncbi:hypothetical protein CK203_053592 [Vitis vinifera]|uniref:Uncharacterized protein n=1 Tax=Vitis vinifera TaxID=29760 RepID=A0A438HIA5_VITVI|nr:hypothetical protein CK203_053592 [Vitis vinifera]